MILPIHSMDFQWKPKQPKTLDITRYYPIGIAIIVVLIGLLMIKEKASYADRTAKEWYKEYEVAKLEVKEEEEYSSFLYKKYEKLDICMREFDKLSDIERQQMPVAAFCLVYDL